MIIVGNVEFLSEEWGLFWNQGQNNTAIHAPSGEVCR
ncbi:hypothetical protein CLV99_0866 [Sphingobacterium yanglingense]|uniref:Uncharacterized protein n=1 Tax=Sphingobacterium yanglingense TaxID=1437280 RepID=A0A4V6PXG4_9SPHI|nr:hypothetical protein CLV99_0866 [Sphingobacterium yanglingense]